MNLGSALASRAEIEDETDRLISLYRETARRQENKEILNTLFPRLSVLHSALDPVQEYHIGYDCGYDAGYDDGEDAGYYNAKRDDEFNFDFPPAPEVSFYDTIDLHNPWAECDWLYELDKPRDLVWDTEPNTSTPFYLI
jgi:hypothetical protein